MSPINAFMLIKIILSQPISPNFRPFKIYNWNPIFFKFSTTDASTLKAVP